MAARAAAGRVGKSAALRRHSFGPVLPVWSWVNIATARAWLGIAPTKNADWAVLVVPVLAMISWPLLIAATGAVHGHRVLHLRGLVGVHRRIGTEHRVTGDLDERRRGVVLGKRRDHVRGMVDAVVVEGRQHGGLLAHGQRRLVERDARLVLRPGDADRPPCNATVTRPIGSRSAAQGRSARAGRPRREKKTGAEGTGPEYPGPKDRENDSL
jgi:hypothetical protein